MKKLTKIKRLYQRCVIAKKIRRKAKLARKKMRARKKSRTKKTKYWDYTCSAPTEFSLMDEIARMELLRFIKTLSEVSSQPGKRVLVDFSRTENMVADGTLLFRAHICRIFNNKPESTKVRCKLPQNRKVSQVLKQIGVLEKFGKFQHIQPDHKDVIHWRYAQGAGALGEKYEEILGHYDGVITEALKERFYVGLTEAMTNTRQHAYDIETTSWNDNEWWMFSQEKDQILYVVFCDLGMGIPGSLPSTQPGLWRRIIEKLGGAPLDSAVIEEAVTSSKSRTGKEHRGKGLKQLASVVENTRNGSMSLCSNCGRYSIKNGKPLKFDYKTSINGTMISWSLPIRQPIE